MKLHRIALSILSAFGLVVAGVADVDARQTDGLSVALSAAKAASNSVALSPDHNRDLSRVVRALRKDKVDRAMRIWAALLSDVSTAGGPLPNVDAMVNYLVGAAYLEVDDKLVELAGRVRFASQRLRIMRHELAVVAARIDEIEGTSEADDLQVERKRMELEEAEREAALADAEDALKANLVFFQDALMKIEDVSQRACDVAFKILGF